MKIQVFIAVARRGEEEEVIAVGSNRRLVDIARDSFIWRPEHEDWEAQIQKHVVDAKFQEEEKLEAVDEQGVAFDKIEGKEVVDAAISEEKIVSDKGKDVSSKVHGKA